MKRVLAAIALLAVGYSLAAAGPNDQGTLLIHAETGISYTDDAGDYCGMSTLSACANANVSVSGTSPAVYYVMAAFEASSSPRLSGVTFGIDYEGEEVVVLDGGPCGDFELPDGDWPDPGSGTSVTWTDAETGYLTDVYWFAGYAPYGGPTLFQLIANPAQGAYFADSSIPSQLDPIGALGTLGFGMAGTVACPATQEGGGEESGGEEEGEESAVSILPTRIDPRVGCWTLLATGSVDELVLVSAGQRIPQSSIERTGSDTQLFHFEGLRDEDGWRVEAMRSGRQVGEVSLARSEMVSNPQIPCQPGQVTITTELGIVAYEPGPDSRSRDDVPISVPELRDRIAALGVTYVMKNVPRDSEVPSRSTSIPELWRSYRLYFSEDACPVALQEVLQETEGVEYARVSGVFVPYDDACDNGITDDAYTFGNQWNLKHFVNHGWVATGANYAWCEGTGDGQVIAIIDQGFPDHPDIDYDDGYSISTECGEHGMTVAVTAAGLINGTNMVGAAPDADVWKLPVRCSPGADDVAAAVDWGLGALPGGAVIMMAFGLTESSDLLEAAVEAAYNADFPIVVGGYVDSYYPAVWDQGSSEKWVISVGGSKKDGNKYSSGSDIYAPTQEIAIAWGDIYLGNWDNVRGSHAVAQVAAAIAVGFDAGALALPVSSVYNSLLSAAPNDVISFSLLTGTTGINDVANVTTTPEASQIVLEWDLLDAEGVLGFTVHSAPSCWGPFATALGFIHVGDPAYTSDGEHYAATVPTPYHRNYSFRLSAVDPDGGTADYFIEDTPSSGIAVSPVGAPDVTITIFDFDEAELRWPGDSSGGSNQSTGYWIYKSGSGSLPTCGEGGDWGTWYTDLVANTLGSCNAGPSNDVCWYDGPIPPGVKYRYRAAAYREDTNGDVVCMSQLSDEVTGSGPDTATAPDAVAEELSFRVEFENPARSGSTISGRITLQRAASVAIDVVDTAGRVTSSSKRELQAGATDLVVNAPATAGVFFVRAKTAQGEKTQKLVVLK